MVCPDPETLSAMADGNLAAIRQGVVVAHLDTCSTCRVVVSALCRSDDDAADAATRIGRYVLIDRIGIGVMGEVWRARDPELDREIAIKLLHHRATGATSGDDRDALLRHEAQAMARVHHPNVVTVHELGTASGYVFSAMELVTGDTLRRWRVGRSWRDIVRAIADAGRGLAAIHRAGLVHRDIKPDNILLANDGRVVVGDLGFAQLVDATAITAATRVGTPAFMAPEVIAGGKATAASDQFSLCVTLFESLYERRPFPASTLAQLVDRVAHPACSAAARTVGGERVPRALRSLLARGLARDAAARFACVDDLVAALDSVTRPRRAQPLATVAAVMAVAAIAGVSAPVVDDREPKLAREVATRGSRAWGPEQRDRIVSAFAATGHPGAERTAAAVSARLDELMTEWRDVRVDVWRATHVRGEQSPEILEVRARCLDTIVDEIKVLVEALENASVPEVVDRAVDVTASLTPPARCYDPRFLRLEGDVAVDPRAPALRARLAAVRVQLNTGSAAEALSAARSLDDAVAASPSIWLAASGRMLRADAEARSGDYAAAEATVRDALVLAARVGDAALVATGWVRLIDVLANAGRYDEAMDLEFAARTAAAQAGGTAAVDLEIVLGTTEARRGAFRDARERYERAVAGARGLGRTAEAAVVLAESYAAWMRVREGDLAGGKRALDAALVAIVARYGSLHPEVASVRHYLGEVARLSNDVEAAARHDEAALDIRRTVFGEHDISTAAAYVSLARVRLLEHRVDDARRLLDAARTGYDELPPTHVVWLNYELVSSDVAAAAGDRATALAAIERAAQIAHRSGATDVPGVVAEQRQIVSQLAKVRTRGRQR